MANLSDLLPSAGGGGLEPIGSLLEPSNVAAVDIALPTGYLFFVLYVWHFRTNIGGAKLAARLSSDGGSTFDTSDDYAHAFSFTHTASSTVWGRRTASLIDYLALSEDISAGSPYYSVLDDCTSRIEIYDARNSAARTKLNFQSQTAIGDPAYNYHTAQAVGGGRKITAASHDYLRLFTYQNNGNPLIAAGKIQLFGVPE